GARGARRRGRARRRRGAGMSLATATATASDPVKATRVLEVEDLHVTFPTADGDVHALRGANLAIDAGEIVGLVGESGSGKTMLGLTALGLLPRDPQPTVAGAVRLDGEDMLAATEEQRRARRGSYVTAVFQDP